MTGIEWINISEALRVAKSYPKGPHSKTGLISAGRKGKFIQKSQDGFHWEFNKERLQRYCEIANKPTLEIIARILFTSKGSVKYCALKNGVKFRVDMGRKYLETEDADRLIKFYKRSHNGK
jgi:hypothetical protein